MGPTYWWSVGSRGFRWSLRPVGGFEAEAELFGLCAFLCRLVSVTICGWFRTHGLLVAFRRPVPGVGAPARFETPEGTVLSTKYYMEYGSKNVNILCRVIAVSRCLTSGRALMAET
jgi:hypothetical protein